MPRGVHIPWNRQVTIPSFLTANVCMTQSVSLTEAIALQFPFTLLVFYSSAHDQFWTLPKKGKRYARRESGRKVLWPIGARDSWVLAADMLRWGTKGVPLGDKTVAQRCKGHGPESQVQHLLLAGMSPMLRMEATHSKSLSEREKKTILALWPMELSIPWIGDPTSLPPHHFAVDKFNPQNEEAKELNRRLVAPSFIRWPSPRGFAIHDDNAQISKW